MSTGTIRLKDINLSSNKKNATSKKCKKLIDLKKNDYNLKMNDYMTF